MITIYLGEDTAISRNKYLEHRLSKKKEGFQIIELSSETIARFDLSQYYAQGLFEEKKIFFGENILTKKENREKVNVFDDLKTDYDLVCFEEAADDRSAKSYFKSAKLVVSKLPANIFTFLDSLYPGNKKNVFAQFKLLQQNTVENIIFYMIGQRVRDLIIIGSNQQTKKNLPPWQYARLKNQASKWKLKRLEQFYEGIYKIEIMTKTSKNYYSLPSALDILLAIYL